MQRRVAVRVYSVDVPARPDQQLRDFEVAVQAGQVQRSLHQVVPNIDVSVLAVVNQVLTDLEKALFGRQVESCSAPFATDGNNRIFSHLT